MKKLLSAALIAGSLVSANANLFNYDVLLNGPNEPTPSLGTGVGWVSYDDLAHTLTLNISWTGLTGTVTASHIHGPTASPFTGTAGVVLTPGTLPSFPTGAGTASGSYATVLNLASAASYPAAYVTANGGLAGAEAAITGAMAAGETYWNIHSTAFPGGEIRGFLVVPEPSSLAILGVAGLGVVVRNRKSRATKA